MRILVTLRKYYLHGGRGQNAEVLHRLHGLQSTFSLRHFFRHTWIDTSLFPCEFETDDSIHVEKLAFPLCRGHSSFSFASLLWYSITSIVMKYKNHRTLCPSTFSNTVHVYFLHPFPFDASTLFL